MKHHFAAIIKHLPAAEPLLFCQPFTILSDDEWNAKFGPGMATACATAEVFWFNRTFWDGLSVGKKRGLILHEAMHGALQHLSDPWVDNTLPRASFHMLANIAQDIVIESSIFALNQKIQPFKAAEERDIVQNYEEEQFKEFAGMGWRQVYEILRSRMKGGSGSGSGSDAGGAVCDLSQARGTAASAELAERWAGAAKESAAIDARVRNAGNSAGGNTLDVTPEEARVPWQTLLREYLQSVPAPVSKSWSRVKRRPFANTGAYVPIMSGSRKVLDRVNLLLDTSGSMSGDYNKLAGEVMAICGMAESVYRVDYDVGVAYRELIEEPLEYEITKLHGGGGTSIRQALKELEEDRDFDKNAICVVLTDGGDSYELADFGVKCVFLSYGGLFKSDSGPVFEVSV